MLVSLQHVEGSCIYTNVHKLIYAFDAKEQVGSGSDEMPLHRPNDWKISTCALDRFARTSPIVVTRSTELVRKRKQQEILGKPGGGRGGKGEESFSRESLRL